jgi:SAM-dependent methyltransferase/uncharacterized protein YbaR (Trm112 family)
MNPNYQRDFRPINGAYKGRGRNYLTLLACPADHAALRVDGDGLRCSADPGHFYPFREGILQLVPAERRGAIEAISTAYDEACAARGWITPDEAGFKSLPQTAIPGYADNYWPQQAAATALLWRFLEAIRLAQGGLPIGPMGEAAIIGAGLGWLAYSLDVAGYTVVAVDARAGSQHGLGVYPIGRYLRVQADLDRLPLAPAAFDWVIFQEGLTPLNPQADESIQAAVLDAALRAVRPGGWVAVMDSLAPSEEDAAAVHTLFEQAGLVLVRSARYTGWRGYLLELRDRIARRDPDVPPVWVGQKPK